MLPLEFYSVFELSFRRVLSNTCGHMYRVLQARSLEAIIGLLSSTSNSVLSATLHTLTHLINVYVLDFSAFSARVMNELYFICYFGVMLSFADSMEDAISMQNVKENMIIPGKLEHPL